jgi:hypothetical protein
MKAGFCVSTVSIVSGLAPMSGKCHGFALLELSKPLSSPANSLRSGAGAVGLACAGKPRVVVNLEALSDSTRMLAVGVHPAGGLEES